MKEWVTGGCLSDQDQVSKRPSYQMTNQPTSQPTKNAYTDAPELRPALFLGSLRLLFWLFFHPSAWRNYVTRVDTALRPDFSLAELGRRQWGNPAFWRLLVMAYLAWPLLVGLLIGLILRLLALPNESIALGVIVGVAVGIIAGVGASVAGSLVAGVAVGIAVGLVVGLLGSVVFGTAGGLTQTYSLDIIISAVIGLAGGLAGGLAYGVAYGVAGGSRNWGSTYSLTRQISGVVTGILIGVAAGQLVSTVTGQVATGLAVGLPFALAVGWRTGKWRRGLVAGLLLGVAGSFSGSDAALGESINVLGLVSLVALVTSLFALPYVLAERIAGPWAGALAGALGSSGGFFLFVTTSQSLLPVLSFSLAGILLGLTLAWWRPVLSYPFLTAWNIALLRLDEQRLARSRQPSLLRWHSAFWDELQRLPLLNLDTHLLLALRYRPAEAAAAMEYLSSSNQRWAAQAAQIELDARQLARCGDTPAIAHVHHSLAAGELAGPASALLRSFSRVSRDVDAAQRQESAYNQRLALNAVEDRLDGLLRELTRSNEPYAARFRPIAAEWRRVVAAQSRRLAEEAELRQEIDNPYIIGVPLTEQQEIFIGRHDVSARIEQLLLDRRRPPLLLYGQRRVGKTSLLNNLGRLLPSTIVPLFVDLQGPASRAQDSLGFLYNVARSLARSAQRQRHVNLPSLSREALAVDPFTHFEEWLDKVEAALGDQMALLMLDEFEVLAGALAKGRFDEEAVLGMLRHLIQHRPRFKVLLSGSHTLDEFQRWAGYLINVQVIHIGFLRQTEARQLVEQPVKDFALRYRPVASRRVLTLTRGHPFLVQLLCAEIVALKNEQPPAVRRLATLADVEAAIPPALAHGRFFFADIRQNQVDEVGLALLRTLAALGEGAVAGREALANGLLPEGEAAGLERTLDRLQQRELIEAADGGYRFQVELVRRWFAGL